MGGGFSLKKVIFQVFLVAMAWFSFVAVSCAESMRAEVTEEFLDLGAVEASCPVVQVDDASVSEKINCAIKQEIDDFTQSVRLASLQQPRLHGTVSYDVTCNKAYTFSCVLTETVFDKNDAEVESFAKGFIFKLATGNKVTYNDIWELAAEAGNTNRYDRKGLTWQLNRQLDRAGVAVLPTLRYAPYPPQNLYMDQKFRCHVIYQPGAVAHKSAGIVDVDIDEIDEG